MATKSRRARWDDAVMRGKSALEQLQDLKESVDEDIQEAIQEVVDTLQEKLDQATSKLEEHVSQAQEAVEDLKELQEEYQDWYDNMPEQLQEGATGEKLQEITYLDLEWDGELELTVPDIETPTADLDLDDLENILDEAEAADLPLGFGRD